MIGDCCDLEAGREDDGDPAEPYWGPGCRCYMHYASLLPARYPDGMRAGWLLLATPR
jgi:hypothetical protein